MNKTNVPPLAWLRAFEAAGRLGSFKNAAQTLNVSPSTVSHQVRDLELVLGVPLFSRTTRSITLTQEGRQYLSPLISAFELIRSAGDALQITPQQFRIGAFPFLTNEVLTPNIVSLKEALSIEQVSFHSETSRNSLLSTNPNQRVDVLVRYNDGPTIPGLLTSKLFDIQLVPVQAAGKPAVSDIKTLLAQPTVSVLGPFDAWEQWGKANQTDSRPARFVMETDSYHAAALAVSRGDGICLGIFPYMNPWLAAGKIETIEQFRCNIKHAAYLVYAPHNQHNPSIPRLHQWLINYLT